VNADRASLFLVDTTTNELYARIFDTGKVDENVPSKEIRFAYSQIDTHESIVEIYHIKLFVPIL
jgi:hypothetical protein